MILDPPAFARSNQALAGYKDINLLGLRLLKPKGFLVTCSCSHPVSEADFRNSIRLAVRDVKRDIRWIEQRGQSTDHPVLDSTPEPAI